VGSKVLGSIDTQTHSSTFQNGGGGNGRASGARALGQSVGRLLNRNGRAGGPKRRISTPRWLWLGMVVCCLPVVAFAFAVHVGVTRNDDTVQTVGEDATQGITVAQQIKLHLAELDSIAVTQLVVEPPVTEADGGYPADYDAKRSELHENLVAAAAQSQGDAYAQTLANIDYVLGHYHALMADSFAAQAAGDAAGALERYRAAHEVMDSTLLPEADRFDRANTYVLNATYGRQLDRSSTTETWIVVTGAGVLVVLVVAQYLLYRRFRRVLNIALVLASALVVLSITSAFTRLDRSEQRLAEARDESFDAVHQLARAQATTQVAHQAQGDRLLDPSDTEAADERFEAATDRLFRLPEAEYGEDPDPDEVVGSIDDVTGDAPAGSAGYLAAVAEGQAFDAANEAIRAFGQYLVADESLRDLVADSDVAVARGDYGVDQSVQTLTDAIAQAQQIQQQAFDGDVDGARSATRGMGAINLGLAGAVILLVLVGFGQRLREYR
jgi:hypothetical protein